jgi:hypothetical protein
LKERRTEAATSDPVRCLWSSCESGEGQLRIRDGGAREEGKNRKRTIIDRNSAISFGSVTGPSSTISMLTFGRERCQRIRRRRRGKGEGRERKRTLLLKSLPESRTYPTPPLIPAAKFLPTDPNTTTRPPVMYSRPFNPTPSTTAVAPEFLTAKRSPARPRK